MPILKSAKKALRQNLRRADRNKIIKSEIESLKRLFRKNAEQKNLAKMEELIKTLTKKLDKAVQKKIMKSNTASRMKSLLAKRINVLKK